MDQTRLTEAIKALVQLVDRLRGPGGCPWDAKQTDSSIKVYLIEEAYEVLDALEKSIPEEVCMELGDLLFHVVFLARLAEERNEFDFVEVIEKITEKMVRRHPHVFGNARVDNVEEVAYNWARIKRNEKNSPEEISSVLKNVPGNLPALLRAHRLSERASKVGFDWVDAKSVWKKVCEEMSELESALIREDRIEIAEEIGDLMFSIVNFARHWGLNAEDQLRITNNKFIQRFKKMESELKGSGIELEDATVEQMDQAWEKIKNQVV